MLIERPLIKFYIIEIDSLIKNQSYLSIIILVGGLCELALKEVCNSTVKFNQLLKKAVANKLINGEEFVAFDNIRKLRNNYIHFDIEKLYQFGLVYLESDKNVTFLHEYEANPLQAASLCLKEDARYVASVYSVLVNFLRRND